MRPDHARLARFCASLLGYLVALVAKHQAPLVHAVAVAVMFAGRGGALVRALVIRPAYVRRAAPLARARSARRPHGARRIARQEPRLAAELRSGTLPSAMTGTVPTPPTGSCGSRACLTGLVLTLVYPEDSNGDEFGSLLTVMAWLVGCGQAVVLRLRYVRRALARRIAQTRREIRGFASVEDPGTVLDLPPDLVEEMRERAIFSRAREPGRRPLAAKV